MTRAFAAVILAYLLCSELSRAEPEASTEAAPSRTVSTLRMLSLSEATAYARAHHPAVRAALARAEAQAASANIPRAQWYPTLGASAQVFAATANNTTGSYISPGSVDIPRIGGTRATGTGSLTPYASTWVGLGVTQELFDFGRIAAQVALEDAATAVEQQRARAVSLDVAFDVEEAYFAVFAAKAILKASEDAFERSRVHRDLAKAGVASGLRSPIELTRAEAALSNLEIAKVRAASGVRTSQMVFAAAVGAQDAAIDVSTTPPAAGELPDLSRALQAAEARDPRLLEAVARLRTEESRTRALAAERRPNLSLTGTVSGRAGNAPASGNGTTPDGAGFVPRVPNWDVGVVLSWPLFDGALDAREAASRAGEQVEREGVARVQAEERAAVQQAYEKVVVARTVLPGLQRAVDAARANYAQADARFKAGLGTSVELADAEGLRSQTEIQLALGDFDLARARAAFGRTIAEEF